PRAVPSRHRGQRPRLQRLRRLRPAESARADSRRADRGRDRRRGRLGPARRLLRPAAARAAGVGAGDARRRPAGPALRVRHGGGRAARRRRAARRIAGGARSPRRRGPRNPRRLRRAAPRGAAAVRRAIGALLCAALAPTACPREPRRVAVPPAPHAARSARPGRSHADPRIRTGAARRASRGRRHAEARTMTRVALTLALTALGGCAGRPAALDPAGPQAARIAGFWWLLLAVSIAVSVVVIAVLLDALARRRCGGLPSPPAVYPMLDRRLTFWNDDASFLYPIL